MKSILFLIVYIATLFLRTATAQPGVLPDAGKTPGDVLTTDRATICVPYYSKHVRHVTETTKKAVRLSYGVAESDRWMYEIDHLIPLLLGGSNDKRNLWPELTTEGFWTAHRKDRLALKVRNAVCHQLVTVATAQSWFASNWKSHWLDYFPTELPPP